VTDVEREIRTYIAENFLLGESGDTLAADASLTRGGIVDSVGVVELMQFLETRYGIVIADEEAVPENIDTIGNIVRYLHGKGAVSAGGGAGVMPNVQPDVARY
jgi:acyl carrier protein